MQKDYEKIRQRAYEIWDREGRQEGRAEEHWQQAEREIASEAAISVNRSEAEVPAQARKSGNGASTSTSAASATVKSAGAPQRKRRGAQTLSQG